MHTEGHLDRGDRDIILYLRSADVLLRLEQLQALEQKSHSYRLMLRYGQ